MPKTIERALETAVVIGAVLTIPLTLLGEAGPPAKWLLALDWSVWAIFVIEYVTLVALSRERARYVMRNPINLAVIVLSYPSFPTLFGLIRLARLVRFLRLLRLLGVTVRAVGALRTVLWRRGLICVTAISTFIILAGGAGLTLLEPQTVRGGLWDGVWWAIVTASTVGYGDIAPSTVWGRVIAVILMLSGVGLISTLAASITTYFLGQEENAALTELTERTIRIERLLSSLVAASPPANIEVTKAGGTPKEVAPPRGPAAVSGGHSA